MRLRGGYRVLVRVRYVKKISPEHCKGYGTFLGQGYGTLGSATPVYLPPDETNNLTDCKLSTVLTQE